MQTAKTSKVKMPPHGPNRDFALRLRDILDKQQMSYTTLGKLSGLDNGVVYRLITGERTPNYRTLVKLITTLHCKFSDLSGVG